MCTVAAREPIGNSDAGIDWREPVPVHLLAPDEHNGSRTLNTPWAPVFAEYQPDPKKQPCLSRCIIPNASFNVFALSYKAHFCVTRLQ